MKPHRNRILALILLATAHAQAATFTLNAGGDAANTSSFDNNGANVWSGGADPSAGNDYVVAVQFLRTPTDANNYTFQGGSLTLNAGGAILHKGTAATNTYTIANLILNGGLIRSGAGSTNNMKLVGGMAVNGTGSTINTDQSPYIIDSIITGTGTLVATGTFTQTYNAVNAYTGNLTVSSGASNTGDALKLGTNLSSTSSWKFAIGATGVNNTISGTGKITLSGALNVDLTSAGTTIGDSWTLVNNATLTETYGGTFSLTGFTSNGAAAGTRLWTRNNSGTYYRFSEATGVLAVIIQDDDFDGLADAWEIANFGNITAQNGTGDPDVDGFNNEAEETAGSNPNNPLSTPLDTDADGLADAWEIANFGNITAQNGTGDPDSDGYTNEQEETATSNPTLTASIPGDINGDSIADGHRLLTGDALGATSFNAGTNWDDALAPVAGQNYFVAVQSLRTPLPAADYTFAGDRLVLFTGGNLLAKEAGVITIPSLVMDGGRLHNATNTNTLSTIAGGMKVNSTSEIYAQNGGFLITAPITGTAQLNITNGATNVTTFTGTNTYAGNLNVTGRLTLGDGVSGSLSFKPGATGVCNAISGTGTVVLNGTFDIDLSSAATVLGSSWTLVNNATLAETYGFNFNITNFADNGDFAGSRLWTYDNGGATYQFSEATGVLTVVNPDSDADGLSDSWEYANFGNLDQTGTDDADFDDVTNEQEETAGTDPNDDTSWPDADVDGLKDVWEVANFGNIASQDASGDADGDLDTNLKEFQNLTDPTYADEWTDSDADGMNDSWEIAYLGGIGALPGADADGDGFTNLEEHDAHTNPNNLPTTVLSPVWSALKNRWSFNGSLTDSVGGSDATIVDVGANNVTYNDLVTPTSIIMSGGAKASSDYVSLGSNLLPNSTTPVTLEFWAKQNSIQNWSRIFDFQSGTGEYLMMAWTQGTNNATDRFEFRDTTYAYTGNAATSLLLDNKNQPWGTANEYHIVVTLEPLAGSAGTTRVTFYSAPTGAASLGAAKGSGETKITLVNLVDTLDALGYSAFGDNTASATYNEVRIWNGSLNLWTREKLHSQGPDNASIPDADVDFLPDDWEIQYFGNTTTATSASADNDADGATNRQEFLAGSNPNNILSTLADTDADGLLDAWEIQYFASITAQNGTGDPDNDGFTNEQEETNGTDPTSADNDGDGLLDSWEITWFGNVTAQNGTGDPDGDTYDNEAEETAGSNPTVTASIPGDVDGDGLLDTWEITHFTNITAQNGAGDPDNDTYNNEAEETAKSDPNNALSIPGDTNGDGLADGHILVTGDVIGTTSFNTGLNWDNTLAPVAGSNYLVRVDGLRTPADAVDYTFAGDNLVFTTGGQFIVKGTGIVTVPSLRLDGGWVANATNANAVFTLAGAVNVTRASSFLCNNQGITVNSTVAGNKDLTISGVAGRIVTFNATNTFTGNFNLNVAGITLGSTGTFKFAPGATTVTNAIIGTGPATLNGAFNIALGAAGNNAGDSWDLITTTGAVTIGSTFTVTGFTADAGAVGARKWTSGNYEYDEATGVLTRTAPATNDTDTDGMDDTWETTYFGGLGQSAAGDFDHDGTDNLTEYRLGLIPNKGSSRFAVTRSASTGQLTWPSLEGVTFRIERSTTLGGWTVLDAAYPAAASPATTTGYTDGAAPVGKGFYRVGLNP